MRTGPEPAGPPGSPPPTGPAAEASTGLSATAPPIPALPRHGNPDGRATVPPQAGAVDTSRPDVVVGDGTAASCTSPAVVDAVATGGIITFLGATNPTVTAATLEP